ncbi:dual specificity protein phosphatase 23-like [Mercenaria mercenaria]|uniref:dual specificity protein phosphatase 23-like n=1 Tax=Mercenaria mercenaria TaxID=6596 RepID=UPI00234E7B7C|nr:dual specificity protein phosphatase 23-like [Mercenaria mercenaria]
MLKQDVASNFLPLPEMPDNFSWVVHNRVAAMGYPDDETNILYLIKNGITHIISLTEFTPRCLRRFPEIEVLSVKVDDLTAPSLDQIKQCLHFIDRCISNEKAVVVHCLHGRGRTGTILACHLVKRYNMDPDDAIETIRNMRPWSVETRRQENMVRTFAESITRTDL